MRNSWFPFIDKNGALGIWDARASPDTTSDDDDAGTSADNAEGKHWRMQLHWPATAISSISTIKFSPTDSHSVSAWLKHLIALLSLNLPRYIRAHTIALLDVHRLFRESRAKYSTTTVSTYNPSTLHRRGMRCGFQTGQEV